MVREVEDGLTPSLASHLRQWALAVVATLMLVAMASSCEKQKEHIAAAVNERDSLPDMVSYGVNNLISDSGVIKYRIVTEEWQMFQSSGNPRSVFPKGVFLTQFDETFHVNSYIQCDTAFHYDSRRLWELRGRVRILTKTGLRFSSEQLYWDEGRHEIYSNKFSRLVTPDRNLEGAYFRSNEQMTKYYVSNTRGSFEKADMEGGNDTLTSAPDTTKAKLRLQTPPRRKSNAVPLTH